MVKNGLLPRVAVLLLVLALVVAAFPAFRAAAQVPVEGPIMVDPTLDVRTHASGLTTPISLAFLGEDEMLVLEKNTGMVKHLAGGIEMGVPLDLAVNFASERGLLGITLDPNFQNNGFVYLYWTCSSPPPTGTPYFPSEIECADEPMLGEDTEDVLAVPLLGNRVDRFVWDGASLTWDMNLVKLRVFQNDSAPIPRGQGDEEQPALGNHDGGVITFGQDGKLYIIIGDVGRRGWLQNLRFGPINENLSEGRGGATPLQTAPDDQFGGPYPDDAHYTGIILRLNGDGTIPADNPFFNVGAEIGGEIGENLQMTFAYGIRNSFGMDIDPLTGNVWTSENGEDAFDELNLVFPGMNSGWIQIMGPANRVPEYKQIETTSLNNEAFPNLQQFRWPPENIADTRGQARSRLFVLPGSRFSNPEFSWKHAIAPAAIGFVESQALGEEFFGDLFVGVSVPEPLGGALFRFNLNASRTDFDVDDPRIRDRVADNLTFHGIEESETLVIGSDFGVVTDIETGPNGNLFVVSLSDGAIYEIFRREGPQPVIFQTNLTGAAEAPGPGDPDGTGIAIVSLFAEEGKVCSGIQVMNITLPALAAHIHVAPVGEPGPVVVPLEAPDELGAAVGCVTGVDPALIEAIIQNPANYYVNVHTEDFPDGAVRGQLDQ